MKIIKTNNSNGLDEFDLRIKEEDGIFSGSVNVDGIGELYFYSSTNFEEMIEKVLDFYFNIIEDTEKFFNLRDSILTEPLGV